MLPFAMRHWDQRRAERRVIAATLLLPLGALVGPLPVSEVMAQAVIQPIPDPAAARLADALQTLSRNPQSSEALIVAGEASLRLGDLDAAVGFFARAESVAPADGRVKAGTATIVLRRDRPADALRLFSEAEQRGAPMTAYSADRGLAYDLVGDSANAQMAYRLALSLGPDDTVTQRLAISQAIGGDRAGSEATLLPLLQRQDLSAYRTRAFALAILGEADEAVTIAETMLPARLSGRLAPYLRYMTRLTRSQQAAAANLGRFPPAAEIGRDGPTIAALSGTVPPEPSPEPATGRYADAGLVPSGEPMGQRPVVQPLPSVAPAGEELPALDDPTPSFAASQPVVQPLPSTPSVSAELPPVESGALSSTTATPIVQPLPSASTATPVVQPLPSTSTTPTVDPEPSASSWDQPAMPPPRAPAPAAPPNAAAVELAPTPPPVSANPATTTPTASVEAEPDLAAAFSHLAQAPRSASAIAGAVDITTIEPPRERPRERPRPPAPPPPPPNPSREWVQLATGRDAAALAFDWRRIKRQAGDALVNDRPHLAPWAGRTRLLIGPFANAAEAQAAVRALAGADVSSFRFTSAAGEEVHPLD